MTTLLIDVDNTFWNMTEQLIKIYNHKYNKNIQYLEVNNWEWLPNNFPNWTYYTERSWFWDSLIPYTNAIATIKNEILSGTNVYFVTASYYTPGLYYKIKKLKSFFTENLIDDSNIIVAQNKNLIYGDILIDDAIHNLVSTKAFPICFSQPWNHQLLYNKKISMCDNWYQIQQKLKNIK